MRVRPRRATTFTPKYLRCQGLQLSPIICAAMAFARKSMTRYPIFADGTVIPAVTHCRYLGVVVDRSLSWSKPVSALRIKPSSFIQVLRVVARLRWGPSEESILQIYQALFVGYLRYCMHVLSTMRSTHLQSLQSIQA